MSRQSYRILLLAVLLLALTGCGRQSAVSTAESTAATAAETSPPTQPLHSPLYLPGVSVEDVITYFNEVCLDAEIVNSGDPSRLQRWETPISYRCIGDYTQDDLRTMKTFVAWLNTLEGFPGMREAAPDEPSNLRVFFCGEEEYLSLMGDSFSGTDGCVTFYYNEFDQIYDAMIGCRTEPEQEIRNSVILEEIYNGLGPINDTRLRPDSLIYADYSTPQELSSVDKLILKLLYHPRMQCGMDAATCEMVIRQLYY